MLHLNGSDYYQEYLEKAKEIDKGRANNFMRNHWVEDVNDIELTLMEKLKALKFMKNLRKMEK